MSTSAPPRAGPDGTLGKRHHVLFALGMAFVITLLVTNTTQSSMGLEAVDGIRSQSEQIDSVEHLLLRLLDAETGVRGYLLTGEPVYLEPYESATTALPKAIERVRQTFANRPSDQQRVTTLLALVDAKREAMSEAVARRTLVGAQSNDLVGRVLMDETRQHIGKLRDELAGEARASLEQSKSRFGLSRTLGNVFATCTMLLMLAVFSGTRRELELRERIATLQASEKRRLEDQVALRTAELSDLARYVNNAREAEKQRLARELHDELGALLTAAKLDAGWMGRRLPPELRAQWQERLDRLQRSLSEGIALKRRIIDDLRPPLLNEMGLIEAMRAMCEDFALGNELDVEVTLPDSIAGIDEERSLALFRIAQEAFTNIRKYAKAKWVGLSLSSNDELVTITISDDGIGFDVAGTALDRHGIAGMRHRVQTYAGRFTVESAPGQGTRIRAEIPLP